MSHNNNDYGGRAKSITLAHVHDLRNVRNKRPKAREGSLALVGSFSSDGGTIKPLGKENP